MAHRHGNPNPSAQSLRTSPCSYPFLTPLPPSPTSAGALRAAPRPTQPPRQAPPAGIPPGPRMSSPAAVFMRRGWVWRGVCGKRAPRTRRWPRLSQARVVARFGPSRRPRCHPKAAAVRRRRRVARRRRRLPRLDAFRAPSAAGAGRIAAPRTRRRDTLSYRSV